jgi:hypothetical protein
VLCVNDSTTGSRENYTNFEATGRKFEIKVRVFCAIAAYTSLQCFRNHDGSKDACYSLACNVKVAVYALIFIDIPKGISWDVSGVTDKCGK